MSPVSQSSDKAAHYYWQQQLSQMAESIANRPCQVAERGRSSWWRSTLAASRVGSDPDGREGRGRGTQGRARCCQWAAAWGQKLLVRGSRWHSVQYIWPGKTWLGGLGLNFLGGGWGEGWSVQWGTSKLVAASCHCWRLPLVNVSSDLLTRIIVNRESSIMRMFTTTMTMTVITWLKQDCCHCWSFAGKCFADRSWTIKISKSEHHGIMYHQREKLRADLYWLLGFEEDKNLSMSGPPGTWVNVIILRIVTMRTTLVMQVRRMKRQKRPTTFPSTTRQQWFDQSNIWLRSRSWTGQGLPRKVLSRPRFRCKCAR